ncbi:hypothetical protein O6H91_18G053000 [Diphasiastrum complanatum]|uniref:Uncharacterized protein n=1 Tax=Diphasiastrum complanatum TaxID=34168 RepID=A0ACC2B176_DIPCM|nr:hypothetical protein O6H91_18G053000 [Diphasiastrum complanatum]
MSRRKDLEGRSSGRAPQFIVGSPLEPARASAANPNDFKANPNGVPAAAAASPDSRDLGRRRQRIERARFCADEGVRAGTQAVTTALLATSIPMSALKPEHSFYKDK